MARKYKCYNVHLYHIFRCSLPKAMGISRSDIFREKEEGTENEKSGLQTNRTDEKSYGHRTNRTETNCTD